MNRRRFVAALSTLTVGGFAGCVGDFHTVGSNGAGKPVGLFVRNYLKRPRTVHVTIDALHGDVRYDAEVWVLPRDMVRKQRVLEAGSYHVEARVKDRMRRSTDWHMGDCSEDDIVIEVGEDGIGITSTCHQ